jgi:hypothetical protein
MAGFELRSTNKKFNALGDNINYAFKLKHSGFPVFKKTFDASDSTVVDVTNDQIIIPQHYMVTGEELIYSTNEDGVGKEIRIDSSSPGVGGTDYLPSSVYAIKVAENKIRVAAARSFALADDYITITSVGIGTTHTLKSTKENTKAIVSLDGVVQSPINDTQFTTTAYAISNTEVDVDDVSNIKVNGLIKINDEILRVRTVGYAGSENKLLVDRAWVGTTRVVHTAPTTVTVVSGNYDIDGDVITFADLPVGWKGGQIGVKSDFFNAVTDSFTFRNDSFQTGTAVKLLSGFPPLPLKNNTQYYLIQNFQNNFSFAADKGDALAGINTINLTTVGVGTHVLVVEGEFPSSSKFNGRFFIRSDYTNNLIIDDISDQFTGAATTFTIQSNGINTVGMATDNGVILINGIFQKPTIDYNFSEVGAATTLTFTGAKNLAGTYVTSSYDVNQNAVPRRGIIVSVASTPGTGYQPQYAGVGTAIVSGLGTVASVSIGYTGSGYRDNTYQIQFNSKSGLGTGAEGTFTVVDGYIDESSVVITNPGFGYTWANGNEPQPVFQHPLAYDDMQLAGSLTGVGASVVAVVGIGSSVNNFKFSNFGYNYRVGDELTVVGLKTDSNIGNGFKEFKLTVTEVQDDTFAGWTPGKLKLLDDLSGEFDGGTRIFTLKETTNGVQNVYNIEKETGSSVELDSHLVIFINDVLQEPGVAYSFDGGNELVFVEAPKQGSKMQIFVYLGTDADVEERTEVQTIKPGDTVIIEKSRDKSLPVTQDERYISSIENVVTLNTPLYAGVGITSTTSPLRPINWFKQQNDVIVGGEIISKARDIYKARINPTTRIITNIGVTTSHLYAQNADLLFEKVQNPDITEFDITIIDSEFVTRQAAIGTATISGFGTVASITLSEPGAGFWKAPTVVIAGPGIGTTAVVTAGVSAAGTVTDFVFTNPGAGYTFSDAPVVFIDAPPARIETRKNVTVSGDFGIITGVGTTATGLQLDFFIPLDSPIRDSELGNVTRSGIATHDYFILSRTNVGNGVTALDRDGSTTVGISTENLDGVFQVAHYDIITAGSISTVRVHTRVATNHGVNTSGMTSGIGTSFGEFSWAKFDITRSTNGKAFTANTENGLTGLSTAPSIIRSPVLP